MRTIALNFIYLSYDHAGGKDQVGLNLLKGFQENGVAKNMYVICNDYSVDSIRSISKDVNIIPLESNNVQERCELFRMLRICFINTFILPSIIQRYAIESILHINANTGVFRQKAFSVVIPHDIKAISHRDLPGLHIPLYKYLLYKAMYYMDFKNADLIIGISDTDKNEIAKFYPKYSSKVVRVYNPIDISFHENIILEKRDIIAINLQFHHKNILTLIKAFELIKDEISENLILIGSVPARVNYLKEYVYEHNLADRVVFTGFISEEERNKYLYNCKLYVSPTLYEGFGMVSVEAMIIGAMTLLSDIPSNVEVTKGLCNYYGPAEDANALAQKIIECLGRQSDFHETERISRKMYATYNYKTIAKEYWKLLENIT